MLCSVSSLTMRVLLVILSLIYCALSACHIDFSFLPQKLIALDGNITQVLESSPPPKSAAEDLIMNLQSYVFNLGPLVNVMPNDAELHGVAKAVFQQGRPKFFSVPIKKDVVQLTFKWTDNQMSVLHYLYDNAEKHWNRFTQEYNKLDII